LSSPPQRPEDAGDSPADPAGPVDCLLCDADRVTEWHFEDDECWVADCLVCATPMVVWRTHGLPHANVEARLLSRLERIAAARYGDEGYWLDGERRRIPDHWHAHARPAGGFFDPASELYGAYDAPAE
jgi:hypothetical protein